MRMARLGLALACWQHNTARHVTIGEKAVFLAVYI